MAKEFIAVVHVRSLVTVCGAKVSGNNVVGVFLCGAEATPGTKARQQRTRALKISNVRANLLVSILAAGSFEFD